MWRASKLKKGQSAIWPPHVYATDAPGGQAVKVERYQADSIFEPLKNRKGVARFCKLGFFKIKFIKSVFTFLHLLFDTEIFGRIYYGCLNEMSKGRGGKSRLNDRRLRLNILHKSSFYTFPNFHSPNSKEALVYYYVFCHFFHHSFIGQKIIRGL